MKSASISILVNGSPSHEFIPQRGLRQGDPLAPFLFNVVAEVLNGLMREAEKQNLFRGFQVGSNKVGISIHNLCSMPQALFSESLDHCQDESPHQASVEKT